MPHFWSIFFENHPYCSKKCERRVVAIKVQVQVNNFES